MQFLFILLTYYITCTRILLKKIGKADLEVCTFCKVIKKDIIKTSIISSFFFFTNFLEQLSFPGLKIISLFLNWEILMLLLPVI